MHRLSKSALCLAFVGLPSAPAFSQDFLPKLGGYLQVRETYGDRLGLSTSLNRARLSASGNLPQRFSYSFLIEYQVPAAGRTPAGISLRDAYVRWSAAPWSLWLGQFKTPFSREFVMPITSLETPDFAAVVDSLAPKRDLGLMGEWNGSLATLSLGVFNGEGQNAAANRDSTVMFVGRATFRPVAPIWIGGSAATYGSDSTRYGGEVGIEQRGVMVRGELIGQRVDGRDRDDLGWYVLGVYRVLPWLHLIGRQEDFQRPGVGLARRVSATTGGCSLELPGGKTRILLDFVSRTAGFPRIKKNRAIAQLQVRF